MSVIAITQEQVRYWIYEDEQYARSHSLTEPDYAFPSGIGKLGYLATGDREMAYARQLLHLKYGTYIPKESCTFNPINYTFEAYVSPVEGEENNQY